MVDVHAVDAEAWQEVRAVRLAALADAPHAFGSTYAREFEFVEADWRRRLQDERAVTYLAYRPHVADDPVGIAGGLFDPESGPNTVELVSMWVNPQARGRGAAAGLVDAIVSWARAERADQVHLWVTESNEQARRLYQRCGFADTGERQPLPSDPTVAEVGMVRSIA